ncbi:MAG: mechanosensitive ion channel protein [Flavobacteriaceae bacterium]|nr:MAG: mechanosensitive ion channel protein [Flavobacteriaceae bacterium]
MIFKNSFVDSISAYLSMYLDGSLLKFVEAIVLTLILCLLFFAINFIIKLFLMPIIKRIVASTKFSWDNILYQNGVFVSIISILSVSVISRATPYLFYKSTFLSQHIGKGLSIVTFVLLINFFYRLMDSLQEISTDQNNYQTIAVRTFTQMIKIVLAILGFFLVSSVLFDFNLQTILASLGAFTAMVLLVFKDVILGFVSGIQIASSKLVKVGDWIELPKQGIEGTVQEINLVSAKILNFDKTITSVPTYDLISTPVTNYQAMKDINRRRIKKALYFNIKSFYFLDPESREFLSKKPLLQGYLEHKKQAELTNIGVFRKYVELYLKSNKHIDQNEVIMVRQLNVGPHGLPLEIYCFTQTSDWLVYEQIQSDIFDHILTLSKDFKLEPIQNISQ